MEHRPVAPVVDPRVQVPYLDILRSFRLSNSESPIPNRFPWHCRLAVQELLRFAIDVQGAESAPIEILLLTDTATNSIYGGDAGVLFEEFVKAGGRLRVLVLGQSINPATSILFSLSQKSPNQVAFRVASKNAVAESKRFGHFMAVGDRAYRFEERHLPYSDSHFEPSDDFNPVVAARVCFNHHDGARSLRAIFDSLWNMSPVAAP